MSSAISSQHALSNPDTVYWFVSESGADVCPTSPDFDPGQAQPCSPSHPMEPFHTDSYGLVVAGFLAARDNGYSRAVVQSASGETRCVEMFDMRPDAPTFLITLGATDDLVGLVGGTVERVPERLLGSRLDASGRTTHIDAHVEDMLGWAPEEFLAIPSIERMHPDDHSRAFESFAELLCRPGGQTRTRTRTAMKGGGWKWLEITHTNLLHTDDPHVTSESLDISAEMEVQSALQEREELLAMLTAALPVGVLHINADAKADISNAAWADITGAEAEGDLEAFFASLQDPAAVRRAIEVARDSGEHADLAIEFSDGNSSCRHADLRVRALAGSVSGRSLLLTLTDMTEAVATQAKLVELAHGDHLTGILNRYGLEVRLVEALEPLTHTSPSLSVLYCDLNNFKAVNDNYGHSVGDSILVGVAERIDAQLQPGDIIGRLGGDEFVAVLLGRTPDQTAAISARICRAVSELSNKFDQPVDLGVSIGSAIAQPGDTFSTLVGRADAAMYAAKSARS